MKSLPRIDWLTDERFAFLKREIGELANPIPSDTLLRETIEFLLTGDRSAAVFLLTRATSLNLRAAIDCSMAIETKLKQVVKRGFSIMKSTAP